MVAIISYEFPVAAKKIKEAVIQLYTLSNNNAMLDAAREINKIQE